MSSQWSLIIGLRATPKSEPGSESWYLDSGRVDEKLETGIPGNRVSGYGVPVFLENTRCAGCESWTVLPFSTRLVYESLLLRIIYTYWPSGRPARQKNIWPKVRTLSQMVWPDLTQSISTLSYNQFCSTYICAFACRTVQQKIKIRSQNVHFHFSWKKKKNCRN